MSLLHAIWLECDRCGQASTDLLGYETAEQAIETATRNGWTRQTLNDGTIRDLCPECLSVQEENLTITFF